MPEITIKVDGANAIRERLRELLAWLSNMSPILRAIDDQVTEQAKRRFEAGAPVPDGMFPTLVG